MKSHRTLFIGCIICLLFLGIAGRAYVLQTVHTYSGACGKLHGLPGVLQKAGFLPSGNCKVDPARNDCTSQSCEVNGRAGLCQKLQIDFRTFACVCVPQPPSR